VRSEGFYVNERKVGIFVNFGGICVNLSMVMSILLSFCLYPSVKVIQDPPLREVKFGELCAIGATRIIGSTFFPDTINSGKHIVQIFRTIFLEI